MACSGSRRGGFGYLRVDILHFWDKREVHSRETMAQIETGIERGNLPLGQSGSGSVAKRFCNLSPWGISGPGCIKPWATWSDLLLNPALCRSLNYRPPKVLSNLNGFCNKLISNNICKVCTQKSLKKNNSPLATEELKSFRKQNFSDSMYKNKTNPPPSSSTTHNIEQLH